MLKHLLLFAVMLLLSVNLVKAQNTTFEQAYNDYQFQLQNYNTQHSEYLLARAQYLQAGTLAAESKARGETAEMLSARDQVVRAYLLAIRIKLIETQGVDNSVRDGLSSRLEADAGWFEDHNQRVSSAGTLQDLVSDSQEAKEHFDETTTPLIYETLIVVPAAKTGNLRRDLSVILSDLKTLVSEIKAEGNHDLRDSDRWLLQIDGKVNRSLDKEIEAQNLLLALQDTKQSRNKNFLGIYSSSIDLLGESYQFIKEAHEFMNEVMRLVRTK